MPSRYSRLSEAGARGVQCRWTAFANAFGSLHRPSGGVCYHLERQWRAASTKSSHELAHIPRRLSCGGTYPRCGILDKGELALIAHHGAACHCPAEAEKLLQLSTVARKQSEMTCGGSEA